MTFFLQIHRSIVDPSFYAEAIILPPKKIIFFLVKLISITVLIVAFTCTFRVVNPRTGLPAVLPALFPDMKITAAGMEPNKETPYSVNPLYIADFISLFTSVPLSYLEISDSTVVVDNRRDVRIEDKSSIRLLFSADVIHVKLSPEFYFTLPYSLIVSEKETLRFTREGISKYVGRHKISLFVNFYLQNIITFGLNIMVGIFFLSFAAFIFKAKHINTFRVYIKLAVFAITPLALETILVTISGAKFVWIWHVALFFSVFILYRGMRYITIQNNNKRSDEF